MIALGFVSPTRLHTAKHGYQPFLDTVTTNYFPRLILFRKTRTIKIDQRPCQRFRQFFGILTDLCRHAGSKLFKVLKQHLGFAKYSSKISVQYK